VRKVRIKKKRSRVGFAVVFAEACEGVLRLRRWSLGQADTTGGGLGG
jgi:hypothetical protein